MKRMLLSLPVGIWTFVVLCSCVGSQVAREVQLGRNALQTGNPQAAVGYLRNAAVLDPNYKTPYSIRESVCGLTWDALTTRSAIFLKLDGYSKKLCPMTKMIPSQASISV